MTQSGSNSVPTPQPSPYPAPQPVAAPSPVAPPPGAQGAPVPPPSPYQQPQVAPQPLPSHAGAPAPAQGHPFQGSGPAAPPHGMPHGGMPQPQAGYAPQAPNMAPPEPPREGGEKPLPRISIHAFCERPDTAGIIQAAHRDWRMSRTNLDIYMGGLHGAVSYYDQQATPGLILIESGLRGPELFSQLEMLAGKCNEDTKVIIIGAANDIQLYRQLMEQGVSDYLVPPFHPLALIRSISDLYQDPENPFVGRVCAFIGAKGGVGASTIAHNVAWAMANDLRQELTLVDMDSSWGTVGLDFNHEAAQGLEDALSQVDRLDATLLDRLMVKYSERLSLLPASGSLAMRVTDDAEAFEKVINEVRGISPMAILDLPHIWNDWVSNTLIGADQVVIVATPDLACLRNAKNIVEYLKQNCPNDEQPLLVINKTGVPKCPEIPVKDFAAALGLNPVLVLPYEPILYAKAANEGKMLAEVDKGGKSTGGFVHLASNLKGEGAVALQGMREQKKQSLLSGLFKSKK